MPEHVDMRGDLHLPEVDAVQAKAKTYAYRAQQADLVTPVVTDILHRITQAAFREGLGEIEVRGGPIGGRGRWSVADWAEPASVARAVFHALRRRGFQVTYHCDVPFWRRPYAVVSWERVNEESGPSTLPMMWGAAPRVQTSAGTDAVALEACSPGLCVFGDTLVMRTEYTRDNGSIEAFVVGTGEAFWGGTSDPSVQRALQVTPVTARVLKPRSPPGHGIEPEV